MPPTSDSYIIKISSSGNLLWEKTYDFNESDQANSVYGLEDGGCIITGRRVPWSQRHVLLLRLDSSGDIVWIKESFKAGIGKGNSIIKTNNNNFIFTGSIYNVFHHDILIGEIDVDGNYIFKRNYGSPGDDCGHSITQANDGGFIIAGEAESCFYDYNEPDFHIIKTNFDGDIIWERLDNKKASRIKHEMPKSIQDKLEGKFNDEKYWDDLIDWYREAMVKFNKSVYPVWEKAQKEIS